MLDACRRTPSWVNPTSTSSLAWEGRSLKCPLPWPVHPQSDGLVNVIGIQALDPRKTPQCSRGASGSLQFPSLGVRCPPLNFLICTHAPRSFHGRPGLLPKPGLALDPEDTEEMPPLIPTRTPSQSDCGFPRRISRRGRGVFRTLQDGSEVVGFQAGEQGVGDLWPKPLPRGPATQGPMVETGRDPAAAGPKPEQAPGGSRGS